MWPLDVLKISLQMVRKAIIKEVRQFIKWAQKGRCLLCPYPLHLHLHHVISVDDCGPDHYLNLVALCPNHHYLVEIIKREVAPKEKHNFGKWLNTAKKAMEVRGWMTPEAVQILDILSHPHPMTGFRAEAKYGDVMDLLAQEVVDEDVKLLGSVNSRRPRIFIGSPSEMKAHRRKQSIFSPESLENTELQRELDDKALELLEHVRPGVYAEVITAHLQALGFPFEARKIPSKGE